jgi:hypothetical protein
VPTYERSPEFIRLHETLSPEQKPAFRATVEKFMADLKAGHRFRKGLRVKGIQAAQGLYELTWADDGRAVFSYGNSIKEGEPHIIWHAVGTHAVLG